MPQLFTDPAPSVVQASLVPLTQLVALSGGTTTATISGTATVTGSVALTAGTAAIGTATVVQTAVGSLITTPVQTTAASFLNTPVQTTAASLLTTAVQTASGSFNTTVWTTSGGALQIKDFFEGSSEGVLTGYATDVKHGYNPAVATTETFISTVGGVAPFMPTNPVTIEAISTSSADTVAGANARTIIVQGLDANFAAQTATLSMNGVSASSASSVTFIRAFRAYVATCGTYASNNAGDITVRQSGSGTSFMKILANDGQARCSHYCVPANKTAFIFDVHFSVESAKAAAINIWQCQTADVTTAPVSAKRSLTKYITTAGPVDIDYKNAPISIPAKTDIWASGVAASTTTGVTTEYTLVLKG